MSGKAKRLGRLLAIRQLNEDIDRRTLGLALASVAEVKAALSRQQTALGDARQAALAALTAGDRGEWLLADAQQEVAVWNRERLDTLLEVRAAEVPPAMQRFIESRRQHQQVSQLVQDASQATQVEENRRAQAASDDWFLSRRSRPED